MLSIRCGSSFVEAEREKLMSLFFSKFLLALEGA